MKPIVISNILGLVIDITTTISSNTILISEYNLLGVVLVSERILG